MQLFHNLTTILSLLELSPVFQQFAQVVKDICVVKASEHEISTFVYTSIGNYSSGAPNPAHLNVPLILHTLRTKNPTAAVINIDSRTPIQRFRDHFNHNILSIVQLSQNKPRDEQLLQTLWQRLHWNIQSWIILFLDDTANEAYVATIFKFCAKERAINVIALQPHMAVQERSYWTLQIFPTQKTVKRTFQPFYRDIFPKHQKNMHGHPLRVIDNAWYPEFYKYTPKQGPKTLSGYMGRALAEYAHHHNATIQFPSSLKVKYYSELRQALDNDTANIGFLLPLILPENRVSSTSVVHHVNWCFMVPMEKPMPPYTFYYSIMDKWVVILFCVSVVLTSLIWARISHRKYQQQQTIIENFVNVSVLQALLGMAFWTNRSNSTIYRAMCIIISLAGVILGTAYSTYLQSFSVNAPKERWSKTIDDLLARGVKVAVSNITVHWMEYNGEFNESDRNIIFFNNFTELLLLRDTLDTSYAYPVSDMWSIYDEQQKYFSRPLFRFTGICLGRNMPLALPLQKNSVYRRSLNKFILKLQEAGLINYWKRHSFVELLEMDVISLEDRNKQPLFVPLKLEDLRVVFMGMGVLLSLSIFCFILEIFWVKLHKLFNRMTEMMRKIMQ